MTNLKEFDCVRFKKDFTLTFRTVPRHLMLKGKISIEDMENVPRTELIIKTGEEGVVVDFPKGSDCLLIELENNTLQNLVSIGSIEVDDYIERI